MDVFKILAAILHLGNVQVTTVGNERSSVSVRFMFALRFLGVKVSGAQLMAHWPPRLRPAMLGPARQTGLAGTRKKAFQGLSYSLVTVHV